MTYFSNLCKGLEACRLSGRFCRATFEQWYVVAVFQLTAEEEEVYIHESMDDWWWWFLPLLLFHFFVEHVFFLLSSFSIFAWFIICQRQPDEGWRGKERAASRGL